MTESELERWEKSFREKVLGSDLGNDPAHDLAHFQRVVQTAKLLCREEFARMEIVLPAAWLHDLVNVPKNDPRRSQASRLSAEAAMLYLVEMDYPAEFHEGIAHAIEAHSYSAGIETRTLEAAVVQDADRLDGLGAVGIARCFAVSGLLRRQLYDPQSPFGEGRDWDDQINTVDHFYVKLFKTVGLLKTRAGKAEGERRAEFMRKFLTQLGREIGSEPV